MEETPIEIHMKDGRKFSFPAGTVTGFVNPDSKKTFINVCNGELAPKLPCSMALIVCNESIRLSYLKPLNSHA